MLLKTKMNAESAKGKLFDAAMAKWKRKKATEVVDVPKEERSPLGLCLLEQFASGMSAAGKQVMLLFGWAMHFLSWQCS